MKHMHYVISHCDLQGEDGESGDPGPVGVSGSAVSPSLPF